MPVQTNLVYIQMESQSDAEHAPRSRNSSYGAIALEGLVRSPVAPFKPSTQVKETMPLPTMSMAASIFNLSKVLIGAGMLALPSGMAAGQGTGLVPAVITLVFSAFASSYTFYIIGVSLHATNTTSFKELLLHTHGLKMGYAIDFIIIILGLALGLLYADFVGDLFVTLLKTFSEVPVWMATRQVVILTITTTILGPLCLQKDLQALRHSSYLGMGAVIYIALFMLFRLVDGSYSPGGEYWEEADDAKSNVGPWSFGIGSTVLMSMLTTAFTAHQNAPQFSSQLENFTHFRFAVVVISAFCLSGVLYMTVMLAGFWTFGMNCEGLVLDNFSDSDPLAFIARLATGISVLCSAPLVFAAFRESVSNCLENRIQLDFHSLSLILLALVTLLSLFFSDVGFIVSMIGSVADGPLMFVLPSMTYIKVMETYPKYEKGRVTKIINCLLIFFGYFLTIFATVISILNTYTTVLK